MRSVSYIIPTLNRSASINELVSQLLRQQYDDFEIVIVDQSPEVDIALQQHSSSRIRYLHIPPSGTTHARNIGVEQAKGEIIIFLDDDCRVSDPRFTQYHVENYDDTEIGGVGGRVIDQDQTLNREQTGPVCWVSPSGRVYPNATGVERVLINAPRGGNMSFRRSVIQEVGGFDEQFRGNAMREETDFSLRVVEAGYDIMFDPRVEVLHLALHHGGSRNMNRRKWYYHFFYNELYFFLKHFSRIHLPIFFIRKTRPVLACMLYYGRARRDWLLTPYWGFRDAVRVYTQQRHD